MKERISLIIIKMSSNCCIGGACGSMGKPWATLGTLQGRKLR